MPLTKPLPVVHIELRNAIESIIPNCLKYDLSISSRISDGNLLVACSISMSPISCDENGVYAECYCSKPSTGVSIPDLAKYIEENPNLAEVITTAWDAMSAAVSSLNEDKKLL